MKKYKGSIIRIAVAVVITAAIVAGIWGFLFPTWVRQASFEAQVLKEYLMERLPELEGASASDISFSAVGVYQVSYNGQTYVVDDPAAQNQIGLFLKNQGSCNYVGRASTICWTATATTLFACCSVVIWPAESMIKDYREERKKKKAQISAEATA